MIKYNATAILLKHCKIVQTFPTNEEIEANTSLKFLHNRKQLSVNYSEPINTSCSGNLCDRQRVMDWLVLKCCGCYNMSTKSTSLVIQHAISVQTATRVSFKMDYLS